MIKLVMMVRRRGDLTHEQFRDHYERVHAPLAQSLFTSLRGYVRNYAEKTVAGAQIRFDVIIELWFEDERGWKEAIAAMDTPGGGRCRRMKKASWTGRRRWQCSCRSTAPTFRELDRSRQRLRSVRRT